MPYVSQRKVDQWIFERRGLRGNTYLIIIQGHYIGTFKALDIAHRHRDRCLEENPIVQKRRRTSGRNGNTVRMQIRQPDIGILFASRRKYLAMSQKSLSKIVNMATVSISSIENGHRLPRRTTVERLCAALGLDKN